MEQQNSEQVKYNELLKKVFNTEDGRELLKLLIKHKQSGKLFTTDPNALYYKAGQYDLIQEFKVQLNTQLDVDGLTPVEIKVYDPFNN